MTSDTRTPSDNHSRAGKIGAYTQHSRHDTRATTAASRAKFLQRFYDEVDPCGELSPPERERRATAARKAYFLKLALLSHKARRANRQRRPHAKAPA